jgi:hypothetical protein
MQTALAGGWSTTGACPPRNRAVVANVGKNFALVMTQRQQKITRGEMRSGSNSKSIL